MSDMDKMFDILDRIHELWERIGHTPVDSPEHQSLIDEIRAARDEYEALNEAPETSSSN